jgi:hypothetical protein
MSIEYRTYLCQSPFLPKRRFSCSYPVPHLYSLRKDDIERRIFSIFADFYEFACGQFIKKTSIPSHKSSLGNLYLSCSAYLSYPHDMSIGHTYSYLTWKINVHLYISHMNLQPIWWVPYRVLHSKLWILNCNILHDFSVRFFESGVLIRNWQVL